MTGREWPALAPYGYASAMSSMKTAVLMIKKAARGASEDKVPMMGAALAYYTTFSIAPMLVIAIGVVGIVFGEKGGAGVFETISGLVGA